MYPGRSIEERTSMAQNVHDITRDFIDGENIKSAVSVEIHELNKESYVSSHA